MVVGELAAVQVVCEKECFEDSLSDDHRELEIKNPTVFIALGFDVIFWRYFHSCYLFSFFGRNNQSISYAFLSMWLNKQCQVPLKFGGRKVKFNKIKSINKSYYT